MRSRIVIGGVHGKFDVFDKLRTLHQKNQFSLALIVGDLFDADSASDVRPLIDGRIDVAVPTYFTLGNVELPALVREKLLSNDGQLCHNLWFLGKRSVFKTSEALRIVSIGGIPDSSDLKSRSDEYSLYRTEADTKSLVGANAADILLTSQWPSEITRGSSVQLPDNVPAPLGDYNVSLLCSKLKPRYLFSISNDLFFEREPFTYPSDQTDGRMLSFTRFISLANYGNNAKQKWLYAFALDPKSGPSELPLSTTACPFSIPGRKRPRQEPTDFRGDRFSSYETHSSSQRYPKKQKGKRPTGPETCFFCLSNPSLATHLITSIGDDAYLTTAKGPLTTKETFPSMKFPGHMLIIPLAHVALLASIQPAETRQSTFAEMTSFRLTLQRMIAHVSGDSLGSLTWEIARKEGIHVHWQILPVATDLVKKGLVEAAFQVEAENERLGVFQTKEIGDGLEMHGDFVRIWIWGSKVRASKDHNADKDDKVGSEAPAKSMVLALEEGVRFDLQFPRKVMAKLLGLEARFQWQECSQTEAEELAEADAFKQAYKSFDPTQ